MSRISGDDGINRTGLVGGFALAMARPEDDASPDNPTQNFCRRLIQ